MIYLAQLFGAIGLIILILSFQNNKKERLLKYQVFSSIFFAIQYFCLNAITGALMHAMTCIRNIIFKKYKENIPIIYLIMIVGVMIVLTIFSYNGLISILPSIGVILYSIAIWQKNLTITRFVEVFGCILFIIYNIKVVAIAGLISTIIEMISAMVAIYRFDLPKIKNNR